MTKHKKLLYPVSIISLVFLTWFLSTFDIQVKSEARAQSEEAYIAQLETLKSEYEANRGYYELLNTEQGRLLYSLEANRKALERAKEILK